jgi:hypothetical protein
MKKVFFQISTISLLAFSVFVTACSKEALTNVAPTESAESTTEVAEDRAAPTITSIGGGSIAGYFSDGKWLGNVASCGNGSYYGYYVINTHDSNNAYNYWTITGSNFGTAQGSVTSSSSAITFQVISWSNTSIKVRPSAPYTLDYKNNLSVTVKKTTNETGSYAVNVIGMIEAGRGFGQCTWEVAYQRKAANLSIPPTAYTSTANISVNYVPAKGDVLDWGNTHTGIIMSVPILTTSNGIKTYTFSLRERNENCNENSASQTTKTFKKSTSAVTQGISSNNSGLGVVTKYYR